MILDLSTAADELLRAGVAVVPLKTDGSKAPAVRWQDYQHRLPEHGELVNWFGTGVTDGLGLGHNARAALITRGLAEISRLGIALGGRSETFMGLAGVGDLILTCTGDLSRNRTVGLRLAAGAGIREILAGLGHVAEGVSTAHEVERLAARIGVDMPITRAVCAVLRGDLAPAAAVSMLLERDPKAEF